MESDACGEPRRPSRRLRRAFAAALFALAIAPSIGLVEAIQSAKTAFVGDAIALGSRDGIGIWPWLVTLAPTIPHSARIHLNVPSTIFYFFGNSLWYPARLHLAPVPVLVTNEDTLSANRIAVAADDLGSLRVDGFTHVLTKTANGVELLDLTRPLPSE